VVENIVCVGWTVITTAVCVLWDVATTLINAILVTLAAAEIGRDLEMRVTATSPLFHVCFFSGGRMR